MMKNVRITMSDDAFDQLKNKAKEAGFPGISSYVLSKFKLLNDDAEAADIVKKARYKAIRFPSIGKPFKLKDLFEKESWESFSKPARIAAGRLFFENVTDGISGIKTGGKTSANHQTYIRTK